MIWGNGLVGSSSWFAAGNQGLSQPGRSMHLSVARLNEALCPSRVPALCVSTHNKRQLVARGLNVATTCSGLVSNSKQPQAEGEGLVPFPLNFSFVPKSPRRTFWKEG